MSPWPVALPGPRQRGPSLPRSGCPQPRPSVVSPARENGAEKGNPEPTGTGTQSHRDPSCSPATLAPSRGVHGPWDPCRSRSTGIHSTPGTGTGTSPGAPGCTAPPGAGTGPGGTRIRSTRYTGPPGVQNGPPPPPPGAAQGVVPRYRCLPSPLTPCTPEQGPTPTTGPAPGPDPDPPPPTSVLRREPAPAAHSRPGFPAAAALPPPVPVQRGPGAGSGGDGGFIPARPGRAIVGRRRRPGSAFPPRPGRSRGRRRPRCAAPPAPAPGREYRRAGTVRGRGGEPGAPGDPWKRRHRNTGHPGRGSTGQPRGYRAPHGEGPPWGTQQPLERDPPPPHPPGAWAPSGEATGVPGTEPCRGPRPWPSPCTPRAGQGLGFTWGHTVPAQPDPHGDNARHPGRRVWQHGAGGRQQRGLGVMEAARPGGRPLETGEVGGRTVVNNPVPHRGPCTAAPWVGALGATGRPRSKLCHLLPPNATRAAKITGVPVFTTLFGHREGLWDVFHVPTKAPSQPSPTRWAA